MPPETLEKILLSPAGLERRLKRHLLKARCRFCATTTPGFEKVLEQEVRLLPESSGVRPIIGGVEFSGPLELVYHANLKLRTANRVVMRVATFTARSYPELYNKAKRIAWELHCGFTNKIAVEAIAGRSRLHHTEHIAQAVFDGCREHMETLGVFVERDKNTAIRFIARFADDVCTVSLDSSGELLYKRGYRRETGHAPLRETIAAGLLVFSEWQKFPLIADPLCGSGTFVIEAALLAVNRAAGIGREFALEAWPSFKRSLWERLRKKAASEENARLSVKLLGSDISPLAVQSAKRNAQKAGAGDLTGFSCRNCFDFNKDGKEGRQGLVIANLPYGKRAFATPQMPDGDDPMAFYQQWGAHLRSHCSGWTYGFIVADRAFIKMAGLPVAKELRFENGGIPVTFVTGTIAERLVQAIIQ
jgi:putative N6-adenine-specific DNA methylase